MAVAKKKSAREREEDEKRAAASGRQASKAPSISAPARQPPSRTRMGLAGQTKKIAYGDAVMYRSEEDGSDENGSGHFFIMSYVDLCLQGQKVRPVIDVDDILNQHWSDPIHRKEDYRLDFFYTLPGTAVINHFFARLEKGE